MLAKLKILLSITVSNTRRNRFTGNDSGICSLLTSRKSRIEDIPVGVSILVYMETASAEKSNAFLGIWMLFRAWITSIELWMCDFIRGSSDFILKSSHVENTANRLFVVLTTGLRETGVLCTFGSP